MFVQCLLSYDVEVLKINIMKRSLPHLGTFEIENMAFFSSEFWKMMLRRAENLAELLDFF